MKKIKKVIKYCAIGFAILLIVNIIFGILWAVGSLSGFLGLTVNTDINKNMEIIGTEQSNINSLDIELGFTSLEIKRGNEFKVESNNSNIKYYSKNGNVEIKEKDSFFDFSSGNTNSAVIVYIPENIYNLYELDVETSGGVVKIKDLQVSNFVFEQGTGETAIENLIVTNKVDIAGGAGKMDILSSSFNNLDLKLGVGEFNLSGVLTGNNEIESGIGNVNINLTNGLDSYRIRTEKGVGMIKIGEKEMSNNEIYGSGITNINIEGGIGNISIN